MTLASSRRGFMFGLGALLVAQPKLLLSQIPMLYGDGLHDDWEGLQALFDGKPVKLLSGDTFAPGRAPSVRGGSYLLSRPVVLGASANGALISGASLLAMPGFNGKEHIMLRQENEGSRIHGCTFFCENLEDDVLHINRAMVGGEITLASTSYNSMGRTGQVGP